ncbi:hypothetical protein [Dryocola clanedunensis]|nr:hypothetical protein [Cedecea sulfonylureivorans]
MLSVPAGAIPVITQPDALDSSPYSRSISDDDLCAWCQHLAYRPGDESLCALQSEGHWPASVDENGYAQRCLDVIFCHGAAA